jgi:hypothetical protein
LCDLVAHKVTPSELRPDIFVLSHHARRER